jgi:cell division inhibitor SepF
MGKLNKLWNWLGLEAEEVQEEVIDMPAVPEENMRSISNVVSIHSNKTMKVVVCEPESFDEVQILADHLKNRKQVIMNFENTPKELSQRILDFVSGTTYALDGNSQQLGQHVFIFTPSNVEIARDARSIMRKHGLGNIFGGDK